MYGRGHERGTRKVRKPSKQTVAKLEAMGATIAKAFEGKTVAQLLEMAKVGNVK